jgi:hypothetical protein
LTLEQAARLGDL